MSAARNISISHNGVDYSGQIMQIESTSLTVEDHGIVSAWLHCKNGSSGIGVGGFCLDQPVSDDDGKFLRREGTAYGLDHLMQFMQTVGVGSWEKLKGQHVIVLYAGSSMLGSMSVGIASLTGDRVFILKEHSEEWQARYANAGVLAG